MAVTVISTPLGHKLGTDLRSGTAIDDGSGNVFLYNIVPHGLSTSDYIYIESNINSYSGFKYVEVYDSNSIFLKDDEFSDRIAYKQSDETRYYISELNHGWQCVHLPIVYELESDLYPVNSVDSVIALGAQYSASEYMNFSVPASNNFKTLEYVWFKTDSSDPGAAYQIISVVNMGLSDILTINLSSDNSIYQVQRYYNNYHVLVNVYAGLPAGHPWETEKPYELASTLRFIPDSNNQIKFSIAEILKGYITTRNNLTLDTLPNNIDFMTAFYIEFAEAYDVSDGTEVTVFESEFEEDTFEGYAVNSMLPFKNIYSGWMSEYVDSSYALARWLTTMDVPLIFVGYFFDISFINTHTGDIKINKNGVLYLTITNPGIGVLRVPIEAEAGDTELCIQAWTGGGETQYNIAVFTGGEDWSIGADASITLTPLETSSDLSQAVSKLAGTYQFYWDISASNSGTFSVLYKKLGVVVGSIIDQPLTTGSNVSSTSITLSDDADELVFSFTATFGPPDPTADYLLTALSISGEQYITESICLRVVSECDTFIADDLRLIETGPFRELQ